MRKSHKLGLTAIAFLVAGFGSWYVLQDPTPANAAPVSPYANELTLEQRRQKQLNMDFPEDVPEHLKQVEKALDSRWGHLGEEVLTAASVDATGDTVFFDREVRAGLRGDGKPAYAQGAHRMYQFKGPVLREVTNPATTAAVTSGKKPGSGFFMQGLQNGKQADRDNMPAPKAPAQGGN